MDLVKVDKRRVTFDLTHNNVIDALPPSTNSISDTLNVTNIVSQTLAFKVKTNNQDRYIVRPNVGLIHPNNQIKISISFHPSVQLPSDSTHPSKDKFLLRIAPILPHQFDHLTQFWQQSESDPIVRGLKFQVDFIFSSQQQQQQQVHSAIPPLLPSQKFHQQHLSNQKEGEQHENQSHHTLQQNSIDQQPTIPHQRDLPPDLLPNSSNPIDSMMKSANNALHSMMQQSEKENLTNNNNNFMSNQQPEQPQPQSQQEQNQSKVIKEEVDESIYNSDQKIPDSSTFEEAVIRVNQLECLLDEKNLEISRLKTELAETKAQTERVLKDAPTTPFTANSIITDPYGGTSIIGISVTFLLVSVLILFLVKS